MWGRFPTGFNYLSFPNRMMSTQLPAVLQDPRGSIAMYRALKQMKELIEQIDSTDDSHEDRINASLDDIDTMMRHIVNS